jgi:hypothetical protein
MAAFIAGAKNGDFDHLLDLILELNRVLDAERGNPEP